MPDIFSRLTTAIRTYIDTRINTPNDGNGSNCPCACHFWGPIAGVTCPLTCPLSAGSTRFDGCHDCDCKSGRFHSLHLKPLFLTRTDERYHYSKTMGEPCYSIQWSAMHALASTDDMNDEETREIARKTLGVEPPVDLTK